MRSHRELQQRVDNLTHEIADLKAELAVARHFCPDCVSAPGNPCITPGRGRTVHKARLDLLAWD